MIFISGEICSKTLHTLCEIASKIYGQTHRFDAKGIYADSVIIFESLFYPYKSGRAIPVSISIQLAVAPKRKKSTINNIRNFKRN